MKPLLLFGNPIPNELISALGETGLIWESRTDLKQMGELNSKQNWAAVIICFYQDPKNSFDLCRRLKNQQFPIEPLLLLTQKDQLQELDLQNHLFDDFCLVPLNNKELKVRVYNLLKKFGENKKDESIKYGPLVLNLETYQAYLDEKPLDLTYMEYELLKFLSSSPGRVFSREILLSQVWGYEYFGGVRTVDVHIRRLRVKLGEEYSNLINTIRSVGYRFGNTNF